jgi:hypothetical protein
MRAALIALAAAVALTSAGPAPAQTPAERADARCILLLSVAARDPKNREKATQGAFYYLGKLAARGQGPRLEGLLGQEARAPMQAQQAQAELTRCGQELSTSNAQLGGAFRSLQASAAAPRPAAPPTTATPGIPNPFTAPPK